MRLGVTTPDVLVDRRLWFDHRTIDHRAFDYNRTPSKCVETTLINRPVIKRPVIKRPVIKRLRTSGRRLFAVLRLSGPLLARTTPVRRAI